MTTQFPAALDTFVDPTGNETLAVSTPPHSSQHSNANDAIAALQAKVGINGSTDPTSLDNKLSSTGTATPQFAQVTVAAPAIGEPAALFVNLLSVGVAGAIGILVEGSLTQVQALLDLRNSSGQPLFQVDAAGGMRLREASNGRAGVATLVAGTVVVSNTSVTANTRIKLYVQAAGGTQGILSSTRVAGTSFTINSTNAADTSTVYWELSEPA